MQIGELAQRRGDWYGRSAGPDAASREHALRGQAQRPADIHCGFTAPRQRGTRCELHSSAPGDESRPDGGAPV